MEKSKPGFSEKHSLKLIILSLLIISIGSWWLGIPEKIMGKESAKEVATIQERKTYYYLMDPMLINVSRASEHNHYLKVRPVLVTENTHFYEDLKSYSPMIRNILLSLYSKETHQSLLAEDGFENLRQKSLEQLKNASGEPRLAAITNVMFNEYVVQ